MVEEDVRNVTAADNRKMPELIGQFLKAALELYDPHHFHGLIGMNKVGKRIGLEDRRLLQKITRRLINTGLLVPDPDTEEIGFFRFTPEGLAKAQQLQQERSR
jgi:hypothetical protein